jgi:putative transposase
VNGAGKAVRLILTAGQSGDPVQAPKLLEGLHPQYVIADAAYSSAAFREQIRESGATACIRANPTHKSDPAYDKERYRHRNVIERFFRSLRNFRRVATRYDKLPENFLGFVHIAALLIHLK